MNIANKSTAFLMSPSVNADGYVSFFNVDMIHTIASIGKYVVITIFEGYNATIDCGNFENANHNLPIIIDAICNSYEDEPKGVIKVNELDGIKGTDGVWTEDYNSTLWT